MIWKSDSSSSSIASNSWSVLSISSISSTTGSSEAIAVISGRASRNSSPKMSSWTASQPVPSRLGLDPQQLLAVVPLVQRLGLVEALVALQAHERAAQVAGERLGQLGLADAGRALDEHRLAEPGGEVGDQRGGLAGQVAGRAGRRRRRRRMREDGGHGAESLGSRALVAGRRRRPRGAVRGPDGAGFLIGASAHSTSRRSRRRRDRADRWSATLLLPRIV